MSLQHIIFDYDGVIANSFSFHLHNLQELGYNISEQEYKDLHTGNFYDNQNDAMRNFDAHKYATHVQDAQARVPLFPNAKEVLKKLHETFSLHIVTSGWERQIEGNLNHHDINTFFSHKRYADHSRSKHEKLSWILKTENAQPQECLFVTDTVGDLREARTVHIPSLAVTFGYHDRMVLQAENPLGCVDSWAGLYDYVVNTL